MSNQYVVIGKTGLHHNFEIGQVVDLRDTRSEDCLFTGLAGGGYISQYISKEDVVPKREYDIERVKQPSSTLCDFYKTSHKPCYPEGMTGLYSMMSCRSDKYSKVKGFNVIFGIQAMIQEYLIEHFNDNFFSRPRWAVMQEYQRVIYHTIINPFDKSVSNIHEVDASHIGALHDLGYLPIKIKAVKEGTVLPVKTPFFTIENTHKDFFWLTNYLETIISTQVWGAITSATTAYKYHQIAKRYAWDTVGNFDHVPFQIHDFSMRGMNGLDAAKISGMAHMLFSKGTDTIPAIHALEAYYGADIAKEIVGTSIVATEHSIMSSLTPADGNRDETEAYRYLLKNNPSGFMSVVSDTYDFWKVIGEVLPALKDEIMARDGRLVVRPDCYDEKTQILTNSGWKFFKDLNSDDLVAQVLDDGSYEFVKPLKYVNEHYKGEMVKFNDNFGKVDLLVTPNHRMIVQIKNVKTGEVTEKVIYAEDMTKSGHHYQKMSRSARAKSNGASLTDLERLKIAFQADGSYSTSGGKIRFSFSKERKMSRLEMLCDNAGVTYKKYKLSDGSFEYSLDIDAGLFTKDFSWVDTSDLDAEFCIEFIEELSHWDSTRRSDTRFKFDTTSKDISDVVELIALSAGYGDLISEYEDDRKEHFSKVYSHNILKDNMVGGQSWSKSTEEYDGNIYCVQVPTGKIIVKRNRGTMVCGNSGDPILILCGDPESDNEYAKKGLIECLYDLFGGTESSKGYKVLDSHIGAIYGDSITPERAELILERLKAKGFASSNVVFGVGSYTYQFVTRDTHGQAIKATWAEIDGKEVMLFKDPKTDDGTKRSLRGRVAVIKHPLDGSIETIDGLTKLQQDSTMGDLLETVFEDGELKRFQKLSEIRGLLGTE